MTIRPLSTRHTGSAVQYRGPLADLQATRRQVITVGVALAGLIALGRGVTASAQGLDIDMAYSEELLGQLGYPALDITVGPDGVDAPSELPEGWYLVSLTAPAPYTGYFDFMQPPAGLDIETATQQALEAGSMDITRMDWGYAGGTNTFVLDVPVRFATYLAPGEYQVAASYYLPEEGSEEIMTLSPLTVTAASGATPTAGTPVGLEAPPVGVRLEMTDDLRYIVTPAVVPTGPQIWEIVNTGTMHSHHVVMARYPDGTTAEAIIGDLAALFSGTPPAGEPLAAQAVGVGYAALQSGGYTTYNEFDLSPGTYAVICYILNVETGVPHLIDGMVTVFTAE